VVRPERIETGNKAKEYKNSFLVRVNNILYKGASLEFYVSFENDQGMRIRVESKSFWQDISTRDKITIGWDEMDTVVLKGESKQ